MVRSLWDVVVVLDIWRLNYELKILENQIGLSSWTRSNSYIERYLVANGGQSTVRFNETKSRPWN